MGPHFVLASDDGKDYRVSGYRPMGHAESIDFCRVLQGGGEVEIWGEGDDAPREIWGEDGRRIVPPARIAPPRTRLDFFAESAEVQPLRDLGQVWLDLTDSEGNTLLICLPAGLAEQIRSRLADAT